MLKNSLTLFFIALSSLTLSAQNLSTAIPHFTGSTGREDPYIITADNEGNYFTAGLFEDTLRIGPNDSLKTTGARDGFLIKHDAQGNRLFYKHFAGVGVQRPYAIITDDNGDFYMTFRYNAEIILEGDTIIGDANYEGLIAKYSKTGTLLWTMPIKGAGDVEAKSISILGEDLYVFGDFTDSLIIESDTVVSTGSKDLFVLHMDTTGQVKNKQYFGSPSMEVAHELILSDSGEIYFSGYFQDSITVFNQTDTSKGKDDLYLCKLHSMDSLAWLYTAGGTENDRGEGLALNKEGQVYLAAIFQGTASIGSTPYTSASGWDALFFQFEQDGSINWLRHLSSSSNFFPKKVGVDYSGSAYLAGEFNTKVNIVELTDSLEGTAWSPFVLKFDTAGSIDFRLIEAKDDWARLQGFHVDKQANLYLSGIFQNTATLIGASQTSIGNLDAFYGKYGCAPYLEQDSVFAPGDTVVFESMNITTDTTFYHMIGGGLGCDTLWLLSYTTDSSLIAGISAASVEGQQATLMLYPNPSEGAVDIAVEGMATNMLRLQLYSINGRLLLDERGNLENLNHGLNSAISNQPSGIYMLSLQDMSNGQYARKKLLLSK